MTRSMSRYVVVLAVLAACTSGCRLVRREQPQVTPKPPVELPPTAPGTAPQNPVDAKLDGPLLELVTSPARPVDKWAARHKVQAPANRIPVEITCKTAADVPSVVASLKKSGSEVKTTFQNVVFAAIAADSIRKVAGLNEVWTVTLGRQTVRPVK